MKKLLVIFLAAAALGGCKPMDRINPTDKEASNFAGVSYEGSIGYFSSLSDFTIARDPSDNRDYIFALDSVKEEVHKYYMDGTPDAIIANGDPKMLITPSGICSLLGCCFIVDKDLQYNLDAFQIDNFLNNKWSAISAGGDKIESYNNVLYMAQADPPAVRAYIPDIAGRTYTAAVQWDIVKGDAACNTCMSAISDISVRAVPDEFLLTDPVLMRVSIYGTDGTHTGRNITIGSPVIGAAAYENRLYVPTTDGIRIYDYNTGKLMSTIANYGVGNGRVGAPGKIRLYGGKNILVGSVTHIKYFSTQGL